SLIEVVDGLAPAARQPGAAKTRAAEKAAPALMAAEEAAQDIAQRDAAGDAGRSRHGVLEEASAAALLRGRPAPRASLRRRIGLRLRRLRRVSGGRRGLRPA